MPDLLSALGGTFSEESGLEKEEMWLDKQLLLSCRHGWVPAPLDFHHYILLSPSLLDAEDGNFRNGGPCWTRTSDTLINSQVLYQLSYASIFSLGEWLRWLDSNQRVRESKSHALPLGYTSIFRGQTLGPSAGVVISTSAPATGFEPVNSTSFWIKKLNPPRLLPA